MNHDKPIISIILLSLLRQEETTNCIESIFRHTKIPFEIIIVDMGKSVEIIDWLKNISLQHPEIKVIFNNDNVGTTRGRNQGIETALGKYIVFLDNDTQVTDDWIEPLICAAESDQNIAACGSKIISPSGKVMNCAEFVKAEYLNGQLVKIGVKFTTGFQTENPVINHTKEVPWYPTTCLLVKKSVLEKTGAFDEKLFLCEEDKDLCLRIKLLGMRIMYVPDSVVYHHHKTPKGEYAGIRNNLTVLMKDKKYFEQKWNCMVFIKHSRTYLHIIGLDDPEIDKIKRFSFFNTILEEDLKITELILTVTNRCNHRCEMCYYHEHLNQQNNELTLDEYQKISASLQKLNILWISGGEPSLRKDLAGICRIFIENNQVKNIFLPSNGSQPDELVEITKQILTENPGIKLTVMFSLEGTQELHDLIHGKPGAFQSVEESIKKLNFLRVKLFSQNTFFSILLNSVVTTQNIANIIPLMEYAKTRLMTDSHGISPMRGEGRDKSQQPPSGKSFAALYEQAKPYFDFYAQRSKMPSEKIQQHHDWLNRRYNLWCDVLSGSQFPFECQAGNLIGVLEPDGGVRICESKPVAANVRDYNYNFQKAWFSTKTDKTRETKTGCSCTHACFINISENSQ